MDYSFDSRWHFVREDIDATFMHYGFNGMAQQFELTVFDDNPRSRQGREVCICTLCLMNWFP